MEFTPRMKQIFQVLLKEECAIPVKNLAKQVGVSKRTVQRELEYANRSLEEYDLKFLSKTGVGVWLEGDAAEKNRLLLDISSGDSFDAANRTERRKRLVLEILKEKGLKKLFYYSSQFGVSEATVSSDLEAVEEWLMRYGLKVTRKPGSGVAVEGNEESYRRAIRAFINENVDTQMLRDACELADGEKRRGGGIRKTGIGQILNDDITERVMDCITGMENARVMTLTENSYAGLIIHISIAVNRILKNEVIEADGRWMDMIKEDDDYELAKAIVHELEEEFEIEIPKVEVSYIYLHIKGSKHEKILWGGIEKDGSSDPEGEEGDYDFFGSRKEIRKLVNEMIETFDKEKAYRLKQDDEFIQGLLAHLQPTVIRLMHGMYIQNPVLEDIQGLYPDIYEKCRRVAGLLEELVGKPVPEEEIGFLTVHFGAALVRLEEQQEQIRRVLVGVVCSSGIGISRLMSSKLKRMFKERIQITTYGKNDMTPYIAARQDFFVASIPLEEFDVPVVYVNPLLNESDLEQIRTMVYQYERMPQKQKDKDVFSMQLEEINIVATQIKTVIAHMEFFKVDNGITFEELLIAVAEKLSPYSDRREQIVEDLWRREQITSQVFAEFGFALLHARTKGVTRPQFGICMTRDLGAFSDARLKGIRIAFIMLVPMEGHVQADNEIMGYISSMLIEDNGFMETVQKGEKEAIREALSGNLKKFFNQYIGRFS